MYIPSINILRGLAALMVCIYHFTNYSDRYGPIFNNNHWLTKFGQLGINGVFVFFVISGCVIPLSLHKYQFELKKLGRFLWKRWLRIEIPYLASIAAVLLVGLVFAVKEGEGFVVEIPRLFHHVIYTVPFTDHEWYNPIYWTLAIEFQFYILIAFVYLLLKNSQTILQILILIMFSLLALWVPDNRLVFHYAPIFALGMLFAMNKLKPFGPLQYYGTAALISALVVYVHGWEIALFSLSTILVIDLIKGTSQKGHQLGNISYSLYLIHGVVGGNLMYLASRHIDQPLLKSGLILAALVVSIVSAWLFWKWIEKPSQEISRKVML